MWRSWLVDLNSDLLDPFALEFTKSQWQIVRVWSMRLEFFIPRPYSGNNLCTYWGRAKTYQGCGAWDSSLLSWKPVSKFEESCFQVFTGVPVTYKSSSFHWSPHNLQVFTGIPKFSDRFPRRSTGVPRAATSVYFCSTSVCTEVVPRCTTSV